MKRITNILVFHKEASIEELIGGSVFALQIDIDSDMTFLEDLRREMRALLEDNERRDRSRSEGPQGK